MGGIWNGEATLLSGNVMQRKHAGATGSYRRLFAALAGVATALLFAVARASAPTIKLASASLADPQQAWNYLTNPATYPSPTTHTTGVAAMTATPEIVKLARALGAGRYTADQYAQRVFDYVRLNIETEFRFGLGKGARGAVIDQSGTPFDQANLMVALLRQGGVGASYQAGPVTLTAREFGLWTGLVYNLNQPNQTFNVNAQAACTLLADGGIPATVNGASSCSAVSGDLTTVTMFHIWVVVNGKVYDPGYKRHILETGLDIPNAMGCGSVSAPSCGTSMNNAAFQPPATSGTLAGAPYVQNVNRAGIQGLLTTYGTGLETRILSSDRFARLEDIAGGAIIDVSYSPTVGQSLPYTSSQPAPFSSAWTDIPDQFRTSLTVQFLGIGSASYPTPTLFLDELYGQRLRVATLGPPNTWTRTSNLYVEGKQVATATYAAGQGTQDIATLTINHPYPASASGSTTLDGTYADETISLYGGQDIRDGNRNYNLGSGITVNDGWPSTITILWSLGRTGKGYQSLMSALQATAVGEVALIQGNGYPVPEGHAALAADLFVQQTAATKVLEDVTKTRLNPHHAIGLVFSVYRDSSISALFNIVTTMSASNATGSSTDRAAAFSTAALLSATLEGSVPQQEQDGWEADSTVSLLSHANDDQEPILSVNNSTFSGVYSTLKGAGYSDARLGVIGQMTQSGYQVILPLKPAPPNVSLPWYGSSGSGQASLGNSGEIVLGTHEIGYDVSERQKGAGAIASTSDPAASALRAVQQNSYTLKGRQSYALDATSGVVRLTPPPDIVVGSGPYPASLYFKRTYSSDSNAQDSCSWDSNLGLNCAPISPGSYRTVLGNGWTHNFQISAEWSNSGMEAFADTSAVRASGTIAALYTAFDLARGTGGSLPQTVTGALLAYTMETSLMKNAFFFHLPEKTLTFVKLPDGKYDAPINEPSAQMTTNAARNGPYCCAYYDYSPTTLQYRSGTGDVMNFTTATGGNNFDIKDWTTPDGVEVQFTYSNPGTSGHGLLSTVSNNLGHRLSFGIGINNYIQAITSVSDENNRTVQYSTSSCVDDTYEEANLTATSQPSPTLEECRGIFSVKDLSGQTTSYSYMPDTDSPDPAGVLEPRLRLRKWFTPSRPSVPYLTITYDQHMQVASLVDALGNTNYSFTAGVTNESDKMSEVQDATGAVTRKYADLYGNPLIEIDGLGRVTQHLYDDARRLAQTTLPEGNGTTYQYDVRSNLLSTTQFAKPGSGFASIVGPTYTYEEGPSVLVCSNLPTCNKVATQKDANNNLTGYSYYAGTGQLLSVTGPALTNGISGNPLTSLCYTGLGTTNYDHSAGPTLYLETGEIRQVIGSTTRVRSLTYNTAHNYDLSTVTLDPSPSLTHDPGGAPTCSSSGSGGLNLKTTYTFDLVGNLQTVDGPRTDVSDVTSYSFDSMRRLTRIVAPAVPAVGLSPNPTPITRFTYDVDGELLTTRHSIVLSPADSDPTSPWPSLNAAEWQTQTRSYWPTGDLKSLQDANQHTTQYGYDAVGHLNLVTDPDGRLTGTVYDQAGEVSCQWKGWNSASAPTGCSWTRASYTDGNQPLRYVAYTYTNNGKQQTVVDADANTTQYVYDGFDRLFFTLFPDPDGGQLCAINGAITTASVPSCTGRQTYEQYGYDSNGNRTSLRTRKADVISYTYDPINLVDTQNVPGLPGINYSYYLTGEPMSVTQGGHSTSYNYDGAGRKHSESNDGRGVTYGYDAAGNRASTTWPDNYQVSYLYDALNRMQDIHEGAITGPVLAHYDYDILSRRRNLTFGANSGNAVSYGYDADRNLTALTHQMAGTSLTFGFGRNGSNQITGLNVSDDFYLPKPSAAIQTGYGINALNELTAAGPVTGTDASGNPIITGASGRFLTIPFDDLSIVIPSVGKGRSARDSAVDPGGNTVVYDLNGNMRRWTGPDGKRDAYTYDVENRLRTATTSIHNVTYDYDALGRRISKTVDGAQTGYLLDGDEEIAEYNVSGGVWPSTPARRYVMGPAVDDRVAMVDATNSNAKSYYHVNHEGSVLVTTDSSGNAGQKLSYDEYGNLSSNAIATGQPFRYTGRRFDEETGLYYYRARYYAPQLGRFLQTDPVGYKDDFDLYTYVHNDPLNFTDPTGEDELQPDIWERVVHEVVKFFGGGDKNPQQQGRGGGEPTIEQRASPVVQGQQAEPGETVTRPRLPGEAKLDPQGLNNVDPITDQQKALIVKTLNNIMNKGNSNSASEGYDNRPDAQTGAQLPAGYGYVSITVPDPSVTNRGQVRLLVGIAPGKEPVFFATVNHYRSFYALFTENEGSGR